MQEQPVRRIPASVVAGIAVGALAAGGGLGWWVWKLHHSYPQSVPPTNQLHHLTPQAVQPSVEQTVQVYWLKSTGEPIELISHQIVLKDASQPDKLLEGAFSKLLAGSNNPAFVSAIPKGTSLRSVKVAEDGIHVDLSREFTTGGGSTSMSARLKQVLYTATSLDPNANVWIDVEGQKLNVLGGEGLEIDQPVTRKNFEKNFSL
jgi:spore germination protein GerM